MMLRQLYKAALALLCGFAWADGNAITGIEVRAETAEKQEIIVQMQQKAVLPPSFAVNTPPRIAFDFAATSNQTGKTSLPGSGFLRNVALAEAGGRTRLVLALLKQANYTTRAEGNNLIIAINAIAPSGSVQQTQFSSSQNRQKETLRDVDFKRGAKGEGRILIDLSNPNVGIDIKQQGKSLVLEFAKVTLPRQLERRVEVSDFGTPVQHVDTYTQGDNVKMVIEPKGSWEYSAYQADGRFTVEVRTVDDEAKRRAQLEKPTYKGEKLSLNFQDIEVRTVLQVLAEHSQKNIIASDTVSGKLTLRIKDVPWDQILEIVMNSRGLDKRENGNVLWVAPREEIAAREKLMLESKAQIVELEPLRTESFPLSYLKAEDLQTMLQNDKQPFLSKRGSVIVEKRNNVLIVNDVPSKLEEIRTLVLRSDVAPRQVSIEARIVVASDDFSRTLGARLGVRGERTAGDNTRVGIGSGTSDSLDILNKGVGSSSTTNINLPSAGIGTFTPSSIGMTILNSSVGGLLSLELQALEAEGNGRTVSSPRTITADQQKAIIRQGQRFYVNRATVDGLVSEEKEAVLMLEVTPRIAPDRKIFMELKITKDALQPNNVVDTRRIETNVLVGNGDTAVLGGVYELTEQDSVTKTPLLGDIPILGNLFKTRNKGNKKTELLIFITPRILDDALTLR